MKLDVLYLNINNFKKTNLVFYLPNILLKQYYEWIFLIIQTI